MWEGPTYQERLELLAVDGVFPSCPDGLAKGAAYDLRVLIEYALVRIGEGREHRFANAVVRGIEREHTGRRLHRYLRHWAQEEQNRLFLYWLVCKNLESSVSQRTVSDIIDYLNMELVGEEFCESAAVPSVCG